MKIRGSGCASLRAEDSQYLFPDAVARLQRGRLFQLSGQRGGRFRQARGGAGHRYFPHFRFAQLSAEPEGGDGSGAGDARDLRSGHLLHRRYS